MEIIRVNTMRYEIMVLYLIYFVQLEEAHDLFLSWQALILQG